MANKAIQIVIEEELLRAADREVRRTKISRSALFREALRAHLRRRDTLEKERRDRAGYERFPPDEFDAWDRVLAWPED
jgi:metal-responsive CopG/Arc/MetJ family transcriptional regulator